MIHSCGKQKCIIHLLDFDVSVSPVFLFWEPYTLTLCIYTQISLISTLHDRNCCRKCYKFCWKLIHHYLDIITYYYYYYCCYSCFCSCHFSNFRPISYSKCPIFGRWKQDMALRLNSRSPNRKSWPSDSNSQPVFWGNYEWQFSH